MKKYYYVFIIAIASVKLYTSEMLKCSANKISKKREILFAKTGFSPFEIVFILYELPGKQR